MHFQPMLSWREPQRGVKGGFAPSSQLITNHYYLERKRKVLSVNGRSSGLVTCRSIACKVEELRVEEECSKRLILGSGFQTADLIQESKRRFGLVVRLIANECYRIRSATYPSYLQPSGLCSLDLWPISLYRIILQDPSANQIAGSSSGPCAV